MALPHLDLIELGNAMAALAQLNQSSVTDRFLEKQQVIEVAARNRS